MNATRLLIALLAAGAGITLGVLAVTGAFSGTHRASTLARRSPACLPATMRHSARLAGTSLYASPAPGSVTANPHTQVSLLGVPAAQIRRVTVVGERSGPHAGQLRAYTQSDGASFVPSRPFRAGEGVSVRVVLGAGRQSKATSFSFRVDTPYPTAQVEPFPNPQAPQAEYQSFRTLPGVQAPLLTVTVPDRDPAAGDVFMTNGPGPGRYGALIYTPAGRLVWFDQLSGGLTAENLSVQSYEGLPHLTFWRGRVLSLGFGQGEDVVMNSHYQTVATIAGGNGLKADLHDFQISPHEIAYATAFNPIRCDLSAVGGARDGAIVDTAVQEIDMKTGLVRWEWHSLDHVAPAEAETEAPRGSAPWDWFHLNSIDVEPSGDLLISARTTWATYQLQAGTGEVLWRLGGNRSSFRMGPGTRTAWQHDARMLPSGEVTLFDDGSNPPVHRQSRALRIALDLKTHRALLRASYTHPSALLAVSQGNAQTLPSGNTLVGYGSIPQISEYSAAGVLLYDAHMPLDMASYRAFRFPWSGQPLTQPAVLANLNSTSEETIVHMSWNGATDVASWRVLAAGGHSDSPTAQTTVPASAFESSAILPEKDVDVKVQALDRFGRVLGTSPAVGVLGYAASLAGEGAL